MTALRFAWQRPLVALAVSFLASTTAAQHGESAAQVATAKEMLATAARVMKDVEEIRGWKFKAPVTQDVRTEAELREYLEGQLAEEYSGGKTAKTEAWLRLLGLLPAGQGLLDTAMEVLINQIGGYYDPEENAFYMMVESARLGETLNQMLIAHELCHALDDQYVGLEKLMKPEGRELTEDETYAIGGVVEGSATALMFAWLGREMRSGALDMAEMLEVQAAESKRAEPLLKAPRYFSLLAANYIVGQHFITRGGTAQDAITSADADNGAAILEVVKNPPRSSEQLLHPDKYWKDADRDEPVRVANDDAVAAVIEQRTGLRVEHRDTIGELVCALLTIPHDKTTNEQLMGNPIYWTNRAATGWGGDRLYLLGAATEDDSLDLSDPSLVWVTAWDTVEDREQFVKAMLKFRGELLNFSVSAEGKCAIFGFGPAAGTAQQLLGILAKVEFSQDGEAWVR